MNTYIADEFTLAEYERLIKFGIERFDFINYTELNHLERFILWRHDVDFSLEQAVILAEIEKAYQVKSTYFIHLHNTFYNALDLDSSNLIQKLIHLERDIGLHFDLAYYPIQSEKTLNYWLSFEKEVLETLFQQPIRTFSFHNPNEYAMSLEKTHYAGMINTYSAFFKEQVQYCSDSNGYWRYRKLLDVLSDEQCQKLQVLTHPEWWTKDALTPRDKIRSYADYRRDKNLFDYDRALQESGRENIR